MNNLSTREAYGQALAELGDLRDDIVVLDADLSKSTKTVEFAKKFPTRFFNMGIAEQNLIGAACGLSTTGKIPFVSTFAVFATGRGFEIIRNSVCYPNLNVKICATHSGVTVGEDGATHQMLEDIGMMRAIPNMTVISPSDDTQTKWAIKEISKINGPVYVRLSRVATPVIYDENAKFEIGKSYQIGKGVDATIFATGVTVSEAIKAKEMLEKDGIYARVIDMYSLKPIDKDMIIKCAKETKMFISVEDHSIIGGLGTAIADVLAKEYPAKLIKLGVHDSFGKSGKAIELMNYFKINADAIVEEIKARFK